MKEWKFDEVDEKYELEIDRIVESVQKEKVKRLLLQFPEGLKPYAQGICDVISDKAGCGCLIWLGSCFGACDVPLEVGQLGVDLIVQFGHSEWGYGEKVRVL